MPHLSASSVDKRLTFHQRPDLQFSTTAGGGSIATDPIAKVHHELSAEETFLLEKLRGGQGISLAELGRQYEARFAPQRIRHEEMYALLIGLHQAGLLSVDSTRQGDSLWRRHQERLSIEKLWVWTKLLAIKLPGFNPQGLLDVSAFVGKAFFSWVGLSLAILLWILACLILIGSSAPFTAELPTINELMKPSGWLSLLLVVAVLKSLHELGHALACHRFGAEVREIGCLLLMFAPCLYSDVTDCWRLSNRWHRIAITLGGVFFEITIAAMAVIIWRFTEPGWLHTTALHVVLVASLGTLLVNLNPLVRYDGYYLLSDLSETPNLWHRSRQAITRRLQALFIESNALQIQEPVWLVIYGMLSKLFLTSLLMMFGWLIIAAATYTKIEILGWVIVSMIGAGLIAPALAAGYRGWKRESMKPSVTLRKRRVALFVLALACLVYLVGFLPVPSSISAQAVVVPEEYEVVAVSHAGRLLKALPEGSQVNQGDALVWLADPELEKQLAITKALYEHSLLEIHLLESQRAIDPKLAAKLPTAKARLQSVEQRLTELRSEIEKLTLHADRDGMLIGSNFFQQATSEGEIDVLNSKHRGAWLEVGTIAAMIIDPKSVEVQLSVPDHALDRVRPGQQVRIALNQVSSGITQGEVNQIARSSRQVAIEHDDKTAIWFVPNQIFDQQQTVRKVRATLTDLPSEVLLIGGGGEARIVADQWPLAHQAWYAITRQFRLPN